MIYSNSGKEKTRVEGRRKGRKEGKGKKFSKPLLISSSTLNSNHFHFTTSPSSTLFSLSLNFRQFSPSFIIFLYTTPIPTVSNYSRVNFIYAPSHACCHLLASCITICILSKSQLNRSVVFPHSLMTAENNVYYSIFVKCASSKYLNLLFCFDFDNINTTWHCYQFPLISFSLSWVLAVEMCRDRYSAM